MYRTLALAIVAGGLAIAGPALAVEPSFDCSNSDSSATDAICANDDLAELDLELTRLYGLALHGPHMAPERESELKATQRGWIKGRDECWKSDIGLEACVADSYATRIHEIRQGYADARGDDGAGISLGPFAVACEGFDAGISAVYVNSGKPLVSLMWKDMIVTLPQVISGSGAKYEGVGWDGGTYSFWTKGRGAMFTMPGQPDMTCAIEHIG